MTKAIDALIQAGEASVRAMRHAVHFRETGLGRPPEQTCVLEIDAMEAALALASAEQSDTETMVHIQPPATSRDRWMYQQGRLAERDPRSREMATFGDSFQKRVQPWMLACFGAAISCDTDERNHRFLEEALELVQACGCSASEAHQLVDYVFNRPKGERAQEVGGVMVTLAALCLARDIDMHAAGETELARIWTKIEAIRAKQAAKPKHSPLPEVTHSIPS